MAPATDPVTRRPAREEARLHGWKEIAVYLGRGVRTVQRWERDLGLPVHRLTTKGAEVVNALPSELDEWWERTNRARAPRADASPAVLPPVPPPVRAVTRRDLGWAVLAIGVLLVGLVGLPDGWLRRMWPSPVRVSALNQPVSWRLDHQRLQISDAQGTPLWEHAFEYPIDEAVYRSGDPADGHAPRSS